MVQLVCFGLCNTTNQSSRLQVLLRKKSTNGAESRTENTVQLHGSEMKPFLYLLDNPISILLQKISSNTCSLELLDCNCVTPGATLQPLHDLIQNEGL